MEIEIFYYWVNAYLNKGMIEASTSDYRDIRSCMTNRVFIKSETVEIPNCPTPSQVEINRELVAGLKNEKSSLLAETHQKIARLDDMINQLLCMDVTA